MDKQFYVENRRRVAPHMTVNDAMLFFSGESVRKTADEDFPFFTNRNFLYLEERQENNLKNFALSALLAVNFLLIKLIKPN